MELSDSNIDMDNSFKNIIISQIVYSFYNNRFLNTLYIIISNQSIIIKYYKNYPYSFQEITIIWADRYPTYYYHMNRRT